jgi:hypothetical protein
MRSAPDIRAVVEIVRGATGEKAKYKEMHVEEAKRLKTLEKENRRLKHVIAQLQLCHARRPLGPSGASSLQEARGIT